VTDGPFSVSVVTFPRVAPSPGFLSRAAGVLMNSPRVDFRPLPHREPLHCVLLFVNSVPSVPLLILLAPTLLDHSVSIGVPSPRLFPPLSVRFLKWNFRSNQPSGRETFSFLVQVCSWMKWFSPFSPFFMVFPLPRHGLLEDPLSFRDPLKAFRS